MVQPSGVNALIAVLGAPAANAGSTNASVEDGDLGQQFSQLLSDSGKEYDEQSAYQPFLKGKLLQTAALGALSAQEIPTHASQTSAQAEQLLEARSQVITPEDANRLIQRIDKILAQDRAPNTVAALTQIKEQISRIARGGEPATIGEVLQAAPAVKDSKLSLLGLTALLTTRKAQVKSHNDEEEEASSTPAVLQPVPTAIFRPDSADDAATQGTPGQQETQTRDELAIASDTVTLITPLSTVGVAAVLPAQEGNAATSLETGSIRFDSLPPVQDIDTRIPSLALKQDDTLPEVNLPRLAEPAVHEKSPRSTAFENIVGAQTITSERVKLDINTANEDNARADAPTTLSNISHSHGFSPTQTVSAAQPVHTVPTHGYSNHAQVSEQVHVAVRQASKDGIEQITVQLDPLELGRVEVNIRTDRDGQTQIAFLVDKPETFDSLSRDARALERSLQEAGIKADTGSMQFNLRQQSQPQLHSDLNGQGQRHQHEPSAHTKTESAGTIAAAEVAGRHYIFSVREGVDISA